MVTQDYCSLHLEAGGPALAFVCRHCDDVTKTQRGMVLHLKAKHGVEVQEDLFKNLAYDVENKRLM